MLILVKQQVQLLTLAVVKLLALSHHHSLVAEAFLLAAAASQVAVAVILANQQLKYNMQRMSNHPLFLCKKHIKQRQYIDKKGLIVNNINTGWQFVKLANSP